MSLVGRDKPDLTDFQTQTQICCKQSAIGGTLAVRAHVARTARYFYTRFPCEEAQTPSKLGHPSYPNAPKFKSLKLPELKKNASYLPFI